MPFVRRALTVTFVGDTTRVRSTLLLMLTEQGPARAVIDVSLVVWMVQIARVAGSDKLWIYERYAASRPLRSHGVLACSLHDERRRLPCRRPGDEVQQNVQALIATPVRSHALKRASDHHSRRQSHA
eukprot:6173202-Pleurochrysis_carterae.AAC.6